MYNVFKRKVLYMRITESRLRSIIRQVIKENWESEKFIKKDIYEFCDFCRIIGHDLSAFNVTGSSRTLDNVAYAWHQMGPEKHDEIYNSCEEMRPDLLPILKRVMGASDRMGTVTRRRRY